MDRVSTSIFAWELGLDGWSRPIHGILPMVIAAKKAWYVYFFRPIENTKEIACIPDIIVYGVTHFSEIVSMFKDGKETPIIKTENIQTEVYTEKVDHIIESIQWHDNAKRWLAICAAGFHNALMIWPPGTGKSLLAKSMKYLLPPMNFSEILEVSQMHSLVGKLHNTQPLVKERPFRSIHHTASKVSLVGWWRGLLPGEISLAHNGLLFLDELPEFQRDVLEALRQPIEDKAVVISRAQWSISYPAKCMIVWAMNPCPCGYYKDPEKHCICSPTSIKKYQSKISGPLLDRFDMILEVSRQNISRNDKKVDRGNLIHESICGARDRQKYRFRNSHILFNSDLSAKDIRNYISLSTTWEDILTTAQKKMHLSHRWVHRTLKVARSIADFDDIEEISTAHILEALQYRSKNTFLE
jgi:magnesium chelatase family protein